jgi:hypothetical protein
MLGYERPPVVTASDIAFPGASGWTSIGRTSPAFGMAQAASQAAGMTPINTASGPVTAGSHLVAVGIVILLVLAYYLDRRVL